MSRIAVTSLTVARFVDRHVSAAVARENLQPTSEPADFVLVLPDGSQVHYAYLELDNGAFLRIRAENDSIVWRKPHVNGPGGAFSVPVMFRESLAGSPATDKVNEVSVDDFVAEVSSNNTEVHGQVKRLYVTSPV